MRLLAALAPQFWGELEFKVSALSISWGKMFKIVAFGRKHCAPTVGQISWM